MPRPFEPGQRVTGDLRKEIVDLIILSIQSIEIDSACKVIWCLSIGFIICQSTDLQYIDWLIEESLHPV